MFCENLFFLLPNIHNRLLPAKKIKDSSSGTSLDNVWGSTNTNTNNNTNTNTNTNNNNTNAPLMNGPGVNPPVVDSNSVVNNPVANPPMTDPPVLNGPGTPYHWTSPPTSPLDTPPPSV